MKKQLKPRKVLWLIESGKKMRRRCWPQSYLYCVISKDTGELMVRRIDEDSKGNVAIIYDRLWVEELFNKGWEEVE